MKPLYSFLLSGILSLFLISCSGSETYRGSWKAVDSDGVKMKIIFGTKSFIVKDSALQDKTFEYSQNSVEIKNSIKTYGIQLNDGRQYKIYFPKANDESVALIKDGSGQTIYTISRKDYITSDDIYKFE